MGWRVLGGGLAAVGVVAGASLLLTPRDHTAAGCFWWTADTVDRVTAGRQGCVRGYFATGGSLAESTDASSYRLRLEQPPERACPFRAGDAVVVRYRGVFDDGRTLVQVEDCR